MRFQGILPTINYYYNKDILTLRFINNHADSGDFTLY